MPEVFLRTMSPHRFDLFIEDNIVRYAVELREAGYANEEAALRKSRNDTQNLLPRGIDTPGHHFFVIVDAATDEEIGDIWIRLEEEPRRSVFVFSLFLDEAHRGKGFGKDAMRKLDDVAMSMGAESINLHVFGQNERAIRLYRSSGYVVRSMNMGKELEPSK